MHEIWDNVVEMHRYFCEKCKSKLNETGTKNAVIERKPRGN